MLVDLYNIRSFGKKNQRPFLDTPCAHEYMRHIMYILLRIYFTGREFLKFQYFIRFTHAYVYDFIFMVIFQEVIYTQKTVGNQKLYYNVTCAVVAARFGITKSTTIIKIRYDRKSHQCFTFFFSTSFTYTYRKSLVDECSCTSTVLFECIQLNKISEKKLSTRFLFF